MRLMGALLQNTYMSLQHSDPRRVHAPHIHVGIRVLQRLG